MKFKWQFHPSKMEYLLEQKKRPVTYSCKSCLKKYMKEHGISQILFYKTKKGRKKWVYLEK